MCAMTLEQFRAAGLSMVLPVEDLDAELRDADLDGNGLVDGEDELAALHGRVHATAEDTEAVLERVAGRLRQAEGEPEARLGDEQRLTDVPELAAVWNGLGRLRRISGPTLGTGSLQDAMNVLGERLSNHDSTFVDLGSGGRFRGYYGPKTRAAVFAFQELHGLPETGEVDRATLHQVDDALQAARALPARPPTARTLRGIFYNDRFGHRVALTFDDGPHPSITPSVLDTLEGHGITGATFFVVGRNVVQYPAIVRDIVARGHALGNHTFTHPNLKNRNTVQIRDELRRTQDAVNEALRQSYPLRQMRPPFGSVNERARRVLREQGLEMIMWQVDSEDWRHRNDHASILGNIFDGPFSVDRAGGSILFHDIQPATESQLDTVIRRLAERSFTVTSIESLLVEKYGS